MAALAMLVDGLTLPASVIPAAQDLARRHVHYGVVVEHYASVMGCLMLPLEHGFGRQFMPKPLDFDRWRIPAAKQKCLRRLGPWAPDPILFANSW